MNRQRGVVDRLKVHGSYQSSIRVSSLKSRRNSPPINSRNLCDILDKPVGTAYNIDRCNELIKEATRKDTLFHFFGHSKDGVLDLGAEAIDVVKFKMMMAKLLDRRSDRTNLSYNLIFFRTPATRQRVNWMPHSGLLLHSLAFVDLWQLKRQYLDDLLLNTDIGS